MKMRLTLRTRTGHEIPLESGRDDIHLVAPGRGPLNSYVDRLVPYFGAAVGLLNNPSTAASQSGSRSLASHAKAP